MEVGEGEEEIDGKVYNMERQKKRRLAIEVHVYRE